MDDALILKNNLKSARMEKGLSQAQLAELIGVSRNTISSIETGQFSPTAKLALILCIALDKKFEELFYFQEEYHGEHLYAPSRQIHIGIRHYKDPGRYKHRDVYKRQLQDLADFVAINPNLEGFEFYPLYVIDMSKLSYK